MEQVVVKIDNLVKRYKELIALDHFSLEIREGEIFGLLGPNGSGKTTTINAIIRYFEGEGAEIRLAAPTGRAAKRMTEATGYEAQTIHRLLELSGMPEDDREGQPIHFERNAENPLETDVIIIDDMISSGESMIDVASELKKRGASRVFCATTFGLFTNGFKKFDEAYENGIIDRILTTNLVYQPTELLSKPWYINVDMSKYMALLIDTLNHDSSISNLLSPVERIQQRVKEYNELHYGE